MRVSGACAAFVHDSLSFVNVPRRCCRPGCPHYAVATLTFVYSDSTAVVGPLATAREPHSWDLCVGHAGRITAPADGSSCATPGRCPPTPTRTTNWSPWPTRCVRAPIGSRMRAHPALSCTALPTPYSPVSNGHVQHAERMPPRRAVVYSRRPSSVPGGGVGICGFCPILRTSGDRERGAAGRSGSPPSGLAVIASAAQPGEAGRHHRV